MALIPWLALRLAGGAIPHPFAIPPGTPSSVQPASFTLRLHAHTTAHIRVNQLDDDLTIMVSTEGHTRRVDGFEFGIESVTIVAETDGVYQVTISSLTHPHSPVRYVLARNSVEPTVTTDRDWAQAEDLATESKARADNANDWDQARELTQNSLDRWNSLGAADFAARTHLKMGDLYFARAQWQQARAEYAGAKGQCDPAAHPRCFAEATNNLGLAALNLSDVEEAKVNLEAARTAWAKLSMRQGEAITDSNLGLLAWQTGEWQEALDRFDAARQVFLPDYPLSYARTLNNLGLVYMSMGDYGRAAGYFQQAVQIAARQPHALREEGRMRMNLGRARMFAGALEAALRDERQAVAIAEKTPDRNGLADALSNLGQVQLRLSKRVEARKALEQSQALYEQTGDLRGLSSVLHQLGLLAAQKGDLAIARQQFQRALKIRLDRRLRDEAAETLYQMALVEHRDGHNEAALPELERAIALVQSLRTNVAGEPLRRDYFAGKQKYSEYYIDTLLADGTPGDRARRVSAAFDAYEQARARALVDLLGGEPPSVARADPALLARRRSLQHRLNYASFQLAALSDTPQHAAAAERLRTEIDGFLAEDDEVEALIQRRNPSAQPANQAATVTLHEVQTTLLTERDRLLEFSLGDAHSFLWLIDRENVQLVPLPGREQIEQDARPVISLMGEWRERQADPRKEVAFQRALRKLARDLRLPPASPDARWMIVPDGILSRVPFGALPVEIGSDSVHARQQALGLECEVVQAPSASVFRLLQQRYVHAAARPISAAAFIDPVFDGWDSRVTRGTSAANSPGATQGTPAGLPLARMVFPETGVDTLRQRIPSGQLWVAAGFKATKSALLSPRMGDYSLLLLSTHAIADDRQPELSRIILTMVGPHGEPQDGVVSLYDLYQLRLDSALVILSGCQTAAGKEVRGEGLVGLSRGFLEAGASGLLASPFDVDAEGSARLVNAFLEGLLAQPALPPSRALLEARRALARTSRWKDPYYWATFVLTAGLN